MRRLLALWLLLPMLAVAQPRDASEAAEDPSALPDGPGQEETFYACTACHSTAIIRRSGLPRPQWDRLMDWMVEKQGMNPDRGRGA
jgi:hypothetical protein